MYLMSILHRSAHITLLMVNNRSSSVEEKSTKAHCSPSSRAKGAEKNANKSMAKEPVDIKQPRPKRDRRPTQKVANNEKQQNEKKKAFKPPIIEELDDDAKQPGGLVSEKNSPLPPYVAISNQSLLYATGTGSSLLSRKEPRSRVVKPMTPNARKAVKLTITTGLTRKKQLIQLRSTKLRAKESLEGEAQEGTYAEYRGPSQG